VFPAETSHVIPVVSAFFFTVRPAGRDRPFASSEPILWQGPKNADEWPPAAGTGQD